MEAAEIDTVVDTRLVVDSPTTSPSKAHENNVIGTMNILAACSCDGSPVRKVVFKSSTHFYGCEQDDPAFFDETMGRPQQPRTPIEQDIVEAEASVAEFAERKPDVSVSILRFTNVLGPSVATSHVDLLSLPVVPMILGFDPRYQFVHEDDVVHALEHAVMHGVPGVFNVAGDGVLALSEVAGLLGKPYAPVLPPWGTGLAASVLRRRGPRIRPRCSHSCATGAASTTVASRRPASATSTPAARPCCSSASTCGYIRSCGAPRSPTATSARSRIPALEPPRQARTREERHGAEPRPAGRAPAVAHEALRTEGDGRGGPTRQRACGPSGAGAAEGRRWPPRGPRSRAPALEAAKRAERAEEPRRSRARPRGRPRARPEPQPPARAPVDDHYDDLEADEVVALLASLERRPPAPARIRARTRQSPGGHQAIESVLARGGSRV